MKSLHLPLSAAPERIPTSHLAASFSILALAAAAPARSATLVLDDFEDGVGRWSRNDKLKAQNPSAPVMLVDVLATRPTTGGPAGSKGAGLFTFKAARDSWASASLRVEGAKWAEADARAIHFWLDADGQSPGVEMILRGTTRNPDGSARDVAYQATDPKTKEPLSVKLSTKRWRQVVVPLDYFRDPSGQGVRSSLASVYLLQFVQRGTWNSRFFSLDNLSISGAGGLVRTASTSAEPAASTSAEPAPTPAATATPDPNAVAVEIDFRRRLGKIRAAANVSLGTRTNEDGTASRPFDNAALSTSLRVLAPKQIRLDAGSMVELIDSSRPSFDFSALQAAARAARGLGAEPLIALSAPPQWGLDARGYGLYASQAARAVSQDTAKPPRLFELSVGGLEPASAVAFYRAAHTSLKAASPLNRVGGIGTSRAEAIDALLKSAPGLDFLSIPFYGATSGEPDVPTLMNATLSLPALRSVAASLDRSRFRLAPLYVTSAGVNAAREEGSGLPSDQRLSILAASAWWSSFLLNGSRLADQIFYADGATPQWGLLNEAGSAFPPYYALWLWNTYFPSGSERVGVKVTGSARGVQVLGANTATAHNALFVNTTAEPQSVRLTIRGFPVLREARLRILNEPLDEKEGIRKVALPKSPFQNFELPPYSTAVLQFIEPPKKSAPRATASRQ